jgi:hypothetical protein
MAVRSAPAVAGRTASIAALAGFTALAIVWTWPVAAHLTTRIPHDLGDPLLNTWILWWNAQAVPLTEQWWSPPVLWPMPGALALSEHLLGLSVVSTPLQLAGASAIAAYNVSLLLSYALSGFFAYLLAARLTGSRAAGLCAGLAFGFSPYRAGQLAHLQVLASQWMPLVLLALHAYIETGARRWLAIFALAWLLQALSNGYYLIIFPITIALWMIWFVPWRTKWRAGIAIAMVWIASSLPLVPIIAKYRVVHTELGLGRTLSDARNFSATASSLFQPPPLLALWPDGSAPNSELYLFPGITMPLLLIVAAVVFVTSMRTTEARSAARSRAPAIFYAGAAIVMWACAFGPGDGGASTFLRPYSYLAALPGFGELRAVSRFAMPASLCAAVAAAYALDLLSRSWARQRVAIASIVMAGLIVDGLTIAIPTMTPPSRVAVSSPEAAVIEIPPDSTYVNLAAMYRSTSHHHPLVNGYSGHVPPHYEILMLALARGDTSALIPFARRRPLVILVHDAQDPGREYRQMIEAIPGIEAQGPIAGGVSFVLPRQADPGRPPLGPIVPATVRESGRFQLDFDLGDARSFSAIEIEVGDRYPDLAARLRLQTSDEGSEWRDVWSDWTGGAALEAALTDPRGVPIRIDTPGARGRFLRVYPASEWMKQGLKIRN